MGRAFGKALILTSSILSSAVWFGSITPSGAQSPGPPTAPGATLEQGGASYSNLLPPDRDEVADSERQTWNLNKFPPQQYMKEIYWDFPEDTVPFVRDSLFQAVGRTYDLTRDNSNGTKTQGWAAGGWLAYRSGLIDDVFGIQAAFYTSQPLVAPSDETGSKLLTSNQRALNVFGQAYARAQISDQEFRGGRQLVDTPLINPQDSRMVPNTFEGVTLDTLPDKERDYDYAVGYLTTIKSRDSNTFISMSDAISGGNVADRGTAFGMLRYRPFEGLSTVFMDYYLPDFVNTGFAQAEYTFQRAKERPNWILGANIIDQQTVGQDLLAGSSFHTFQASGKIQAAYAGFTVFTAGSAAGDASKIYSPFGAKPNYTDMQQVSFDNAGEKALGGSIAYDFAYAFGEYGLSGLTIGLWDTQGWGARSMGAGVPERNELDVWLQYRPTSGLLQGFRFKTQYSDLWQAGNARNPQSELRFVLDYTVLFRPPPGSTASD
jgi:outer membrane porin, OprD family